MSSYLRKKAGLWLASWQKKELPCMLIQENLLNLKEIFFPVHLKITAFASLNFAR